MSFISSFISSEGSKISKILQAQREDWLSQEQVYYNLAPEVRQKVNLHFLDLTIDCKRKFFKYLNPKEKFNFYLYLRILRTEFEIDSSCLFWINSSLDILLKELTGSEIVKTISNLEDNYFRVWLEDYFFQKGKKRTFFSCIYGKRKRGNRSISLFELVLEGTFFPKVNLKKIKKPTKEQFRKGYRDHGSLGSDFARTNKEASWDVWVQEEINRRNKEQEDRLKFLKGFIE